MSEGPRWAPRQPTGPSPDDPIAEHFRQAELARKESVKARDAEAREAALRQPKAPSPEPEELLSPSDVPKNANKADTDVFDILGIPKSNDYLQAEQRKHAMLMKSAQKFTDILIQRRKPLIQAKGKFGDKWNKAFMRRASAPEILPPKAPALPWDEFEMTQDDSNYHVDEVARFNRPLQPAKKGSSLNLGAQCFALRWNTDGYIATAYFDGTIQVHDLEQKQLVHEVNMMRLRQYEMVRTGSMDPEKLNDPLPPGAGGLSLLVAPAVTNLRWMPTGDWRQPSPVLASVDTNGTLALWQVGQGGMALQAYTTDEDNELYGVDFCGSGIVCAGRNRYVSVFDAQTLEIKGQLKGRRGDGTSELTTHTNRVVSVKAHPTERDLFVSGGLDRAVKVWDLRVGEPVSSIGGPELAGDCLDFSSNGDWLLTASGRNSDQLELFDWRMSTRIFFADFGGHLDLFRQCSVTCAGFSKDPKSQFLFAGGQADAYARVFASPRAGDPLAQDAMPTGVPLPGSPVRSASTPAGQSAESQTCLLEGEKGLLHAVSTWTGSEVAYRCVEGSPSGEMVSFGLTDGTVLVSTAAK